MTIPELRDALIAAHVQLAMHQRTQDALGAVRAWKEAERLGADLARAESAQRYEEMRRASEADWDVLKGHPDHSGMSAAEHAYIHSDEFTTRLEGSIARLGRRG